MKKKWIWIGAGGLLLVAVIALNVARGSGEKTTGVQMGRVRREDVVATVKAPGKIEPQTQVKISADLPGKIVKLYVREGDTVERGALLLQLDDTQYRANVQQSEAALRSARARLAQERSTFGATEGTHRRQRALFEQKLLSQQEWDQAQANYESQRSSLESAEQEVQRAEGVLLGARDNLAKCRFVAPLSGVVSALNVEAGEIVVTGTMNNAGTQILTVSDLSRMLVRTDVDETDVVNMKLGQKAKITVDAVPDTSFAGTVIEIGNTAKRSLTSTIEGQTNFEVKVVFDHAPPEVRPGMTADVEISTDKRTQTLAVPIQSVVVRMQRDLDRVGRKGRAARPKRGDALAAEEDTVGKRDKEITGVFVVREGAAHFVPVRTGISGTTMIEVFGDLKEGDRIVSGPYRALRDLKPNGKVKQESGERARK